MAEIKVTTYEQDRLYFFVDQVGLAQKKYNRLFKTFKDAPYLSEGAQFLSDAGRELQFYKDVVEMLDKGYRKQSEMLTEFLQMVENVCRYEASLSYKVIEEGVKRQFARKGGAE